MTTIYSRAFQRVLRLLRPPSENYWQLLIRSPLLPQPGRPPAALAQPQSCKPERASPSIATKLPHGAGGEVTPHAHAARPASASASECGISSGVWTESTGQERVTQSRVHTQLNALDSGIAHVGRTDQRLTASAHSLSDCSRAHSLTNTHDSLARHCTS